MLILGSKLSPALRAEVLNAFGYRWTVENERRARDWYRAGNHQPPTMLLVTDAQWLADHAFHVVADGSRLSAKSRHAEPSFMATNGGAA